MMILGILILLYCRTLPSSVRKPIQHDYCLWRKDWECDAAVYICSYTYCAAPFSPAPHTFLFLFFQTIWWRICCPPHKVHHQ
mmetsp:Transcript_5337/g.7855  ORF Transcript_5337/g.7855 Transcript_5337/m.7855 type:complete len:82 (+) Transcript_5337:518-763(+)